MLNVSSSTLRQWENAGLTHPSRMPSGYRGYSRKDVEHLKHIRHLRAEKNLNVDAIKHLLGGKENGKRPETVNSESAKIGHRLRRLRRDRGLTLAEAAADAGLDPPGLGIMVEVAATAAAAATFAPAVDFFSIGTNDLSSEVLGLDRADPGTRPALAADPRVLTLIERVVHAARTAGVKVSVCGDAAAHPTVMPLLVGLGCDVLSVAPAAVNKIRYRIRRLGYDDCQALAADALGCESAEEVWRLVDEHGTGR